MYPSLTRFRTIRRIAAICALLFFSGTAIIISSAGRRDSLTAAVRPVSATLVIDAGHGGLDGGAVSADGVQESGINLAIAQKLHDLCRLLGEDCILTRSSESLDYPPEAKTVREKKLWDQKKRVAKANAAENAVLISIHQNLYPDPRPCGSQVLYAGTEGSQLLAELTHENLRVHLCPGNRRVAVPAADTIFLLKSICCPAILVECGFLSNPAEASRLAASDYQTEIAAILCASYLQFISPLS